MELGHVKLKKMNDLDFKMLVLLSAAKEAPAVGLPRKSSQVGCRAALLSELSRQ